MKKIYIILVVLMSFGVCFADEERTEEAIPKTFIMNWSFEASAVSDTVKVLIMVNPKKQIQSGTTYYSIDPINQNSQLVVYKGKDLTDYPLIKLYFNLGVVAR